MHLHQPRHGAELPLQRGRDHRSHDVRRRAGIQGLHLNGGVVDLRQGRYGQIAVAQQPRKQQGRHEQRSGHRAENENARKIHAGSGVRCGTMEFFVEEGRRGRFNCLHFPAVAQAEQARLRPWACPHWPPRSPCCRRAAGPVRPLSRFRRRPAPFPLPSDCPLSDPR